MRILVILAHSNPFPGAGWKRIQNFGQTWNSYGNEIDIVGTFSWRTYNKHGSKNHTSYQLHNIIPTIHLSSVFAFIMNFFCSFVSVLIFLIIKRPEVVLVSMPPGSNGLGSIIACIITRRSYVIDYRDEWEYVFIGYSKTRSGKLIRLLIMHFATLLYKQSKLVVTVNNSLAQSLKRRGVCDVSIIMNGADTSVFFPSVRPNQKSQFSIVYIGGIGDYYNIEQVLNALAYLSDHGLSQLKFSFAGIGNSGEILRLAKQLGIEDRVQYLGVIKDTKSLVSLIQSADIGVIPFDDNPLWNHALPAKLFEYSACGVPTLATVHENSELAKIILDHEVGIVTPPLDSVKLAEALSWAMDNPQEMGIYRKNARELVLKYYDRTVQSKRLLELIQKKNDETN